MKLNKQFTIKWKQTDHSTFLYGTKLSFRSTETIFENVLMPSGIVIQEWKMLRTYGDDRSTPQLPILEKGKQYQFNFDYEVTPTAGIYFKIIFYRKNGTEICNQIIKQKQKSITYPEETYAYKVQLINAAATYLKFKKINIEDNNSENIKQSDIEISSLKNEKATSHTLNVVIEEPSEDIVLPLLDHVIKHIEHVVVVRHWEADDMQRRLNVLINYLKAQSDAQEIRLIGYGPRSNELAKVLNRIVRSKVYITSHRNVQLAQTLKTELDDLSNIDAAMPYIYFNHEAQSDVLGVFQGRLNYARYLKYLEHSLINSEVSYETES